MLFTLPPQLQHLQVTDWFLLIQIPLAFGAMMAVLAFDVAPRLRKIRRSISRSRSCLFPVRKSLFAVRFRIGRSRSVK
jgi:hypothetical protein